jgi:hypothetical protein
VDGRRLVSLSIKVKCARAFIRYAAGKPCHLYTLFDLDPAGPSMRAVLERDIRRVIAMEAPPGRAPMLQVHPLALNADQVRDWGLPSRPTKRNPHDHLAKKFKGRSTELDAIPPARLQALVEDAIRQHLDPAAWARAERRDERERAELREVAATWPPRGARRRRGR